MKKLLSLAAVVLVAVSARAAVLDWNISGTSAQEGYTVYILLSDPGSFADVAALQEAAVDSASIANQGRNKYNTGAQHAPVANADAAKSVFVAIVNPSDTKGYTIYSAGDLSALVYDPDAQESSSGSFNTLTVSSALSGGTSREWTAVPEPSAVALLALGLAAIGLKRKVA